MGGGIGHACGIPNPDPNRAQVITAATAAGIAFAASLGADQVETLLGLGPGLELLVLGPGLGWLVLGPGLGLGSGLRLRLYN